MSTNVSGNRKAIFVAVYRNVLRTGKSNRKLLFIGNIPVSGYVNRIRAKYTAKWNVQIVGMLFQTRSNIC